MNVRIGAPDGSQDMHLTGYVRSEQFPAEQAAELLSEWAMKNGSAIVASLKPKVDPHASVAYVPSAGPAPVKYVVTDMAQAEVKTFVAAAPPKKQSTYLKHLLGKK